MRKYIFSLVLSVGMMMVTVVYGDVTTDTTGGPGFWTPTNQTNTTIWPTNLWWTNTSNGGNTSPTKVLTTEEVPWANCVCAPWANCSKVETRKYECTVGKWLTAFQNMFREIVRWIVYVVMLLGVLAIVGAGILWAWGSDSEEQTKKAKWWVVNIIIGLAILFTFRYILGFLAPWIFV